ncbi:PBP1A family penicillin-binding protein [Aliikangiella marina]|uniref:Penicillin-binding protein 1A n=1 Tax=Aliikangiella marina TaxID=1712262 RepID=A0A545TBL8_9GAMM|nr:PBP1A family penicillin-binding protein [Aliikangiella marina]TQV74623.1 PBP1A family penicillin-binding protein [Aliikangiella marina]
MKFLSAITPKFLYFATLFTVTSSMGFVALYLAVGPGLPEVDSIRQIRLQTPMSIYAKDGQLIDEFGDRRRIPITLDQVPKDFINALLATEDQRFYEHSGVDLLGVMRAFLNLAVTQTKSQGASTITMLVARNYYLSREKRFSRKFTEMFLAWKIESELSKNEILELFLNKIPFGHRAYGLGAASQVYYGTTLDNLSIAQLATLAGIPKGQSVYNPISYPERALSRRSHVLGRMLAENHIDQAQYEQSMAEPIETSKHGASKTVEAPYLAEMVRQYVIDKYGRESAYNDGLKIYTTLDPKLQQFASDALVLGLEEYDRRHGYRGPEQQISLAPNTPREELNDIVNDLPVIGKLLPALVLEVNAEVATILLKNDVTSQLDLDAVKWARKYVDENHLGKKVTEVTQVLTPGDVIRVRQQSRSDLVDSYELAQIPDVSGGFVSLKPDNGAIEVLVGGYDFSLNQYNMVTQARRQPGSNIKPFVYAAAFDKEYTPASMINDMPIVEADITAENFWRPKNDSDNYAGPTSLRTALRRSKNTVSVRLIREIGPRYTKRYLENLGFPGEHMQPYLSLALGSPNFTPLEVVKGYATLANGGYKVEPWFVERIESSEGRIIFQHQPLTVCQVCEAVIAEQKAKKEANLQDLIVDASLKSENQAQSFELVADSSQMADQETETNTDEILNEFSGLPLMPFPENQVAPRVIEKRNHYLVDNILKDVIHRGTATRTLTRNKSPLLKRNDLAGKTGTTNDAKDAWFSGYNLSHVATAWVGFDDHSKKLGVREFGGIAALPIWQRFMESAVKGHPQNNFQRPEGIITARIDPSNGKLATSLTQNPIFELFREEFVPTEYAEKPIQDIFNNDKETVEDEEIF